ncbi:MAG: hydrogenase expression/formation protein HypE [Deltaproteobacteria bacterium]|nr:hydrogenase expression/formation protein HypE [Deltaproteobacteria bacterium]
MNDWDGPGERRVSLAEGAGGRAMRALIQEVFLQSGPPGPPGTLGADCMDDGAAIPVDGRWLIMTTDSHVVKPLFFPGGDIGRIAVSGTVNDLAMMGCTEPLGLTLGVVVEEGFSRELLERVQASIAETCREAGVAIVSGDTKVMGRGELDGLVLNTTGVGFAPRVVRDVGLAHGDLLLVTGTVGDHGLAVMAARGGLELGGELRSDVAPIGALVRRALDAGGEGLVAMKDPTRGGLASALHELAAKSGLGITLDERAVPVSTGARAASELLGIDPLHVANEGKAVMAVRPEAAERVLAALRSHPLGRDAAIIGRCTTEQPGRVIVDTGFGRRLLSEPEGEPMPRIC